MNNKLTYFVVLITLSLLLSSCTTKVTTGSSIGAAVGVAAGSQVGKGKEKMAAMMLGGVLGFWIGGEIGKYMEQADQKRVRQILEEVPDEQSLAWKNTKTQHQYEVIPTNTVKTNKTYCREYLTKARINGKYMTQKAKACRQPDGTWHNEN
ncbi:17 kDa surface antigen precursor [Beggiatoa sp. PS]|nr:17 kDa surface antigen precursor [Beggiatoa sp. PS]